MDLGFGALLLSVVVGAVGLAVFIYGRRQGRFPQVVGGLLLMVYPYFIPNPWITAGIAAAILAGLWIAVRAGA